MGESRVAGLRLMLPRPLLHCALGPARAAAKVAVRQNLAIPLKVAGFGDVTVAVRFDGEAAP